MRNQCLSVSLAKPSRVSCTFCGVNSVKLSYKLLSLCRLCAGRPEKSVTRMAGVFADLVLNMEDRAAADTAWYGAYWRMCRISSTTFSAEVLGVVLESPYFW